MSGHGVFQTLSGIVSSNSEASARMQAFTTLVKTYVESHDVACLRELVDCMLAEEASPFALFARPVLQQVTESMDKLTNPELKELGLHMLDRLRGRVVSFEEEDFVIRELLSEVFQAEGDWSEAAKLLAAINLETGTRCRTSQQKAEKYVKIAELYLEDEDPVSADTFCTRSAMVMHEVSDTTLQLRYRVCHARILDSKRKFQDAASKYAELSQQTVGGQVAEEDLLQLLRCAVTCAILAPAGPQRSRILASLCKDDRIRTVEHYEILQKMFLERLIRSGEVKKFEESLQPHQKATMADGQTVLERAVLQHNVLAASRVYKNMRLPDLGTLLEVPADHAEKIAAKMIAERRLEGYIDQKSGIIHFESDEHLQQWDRHISNLCSQVSSTLSLIRSQQAQAVA
eukprot:TRINITY_DN66409_c0_g1_i1.p1 TRINITY_DN66409_c0_g1~~TRINITY_DN66409_c0_g1_i1.p1  ORF type:complete len:446 (+),score=101.29 TRINITY_DN66409_c0_g1_i1:137-1339(+)